MYGFLHHSMLIFYYFLKKTYFKCVIDTVKILFKRIHTLDEVLLIAYNFTNYFYLLEALLHILVIGLSFNNPWVPNTLWGMTDCLQARLCIGLGTLINVMQDGNVTSADGAFCTLILCPEHLLLHKLHWLPVDFWMQFKMLVITYKNWLSERLLTTQLSNMFQQFQA